MRDRELWRLADPARTLCEALRRVPAEPDDVLVVMVRRSDEEEVVDVTRVHTGATPDQEDASDLLSRHAESVAGERSWPAPPEFLFVTLVCRTGRVVPMAQDFLWLEGWLFSNHMSNALYGDVYLVTEHGWTGCMDQRAGFEPCLAASPPTGCTPTANPLTAHPLMASPPTASPPMSVRPLP